MGTPETNLYTDMTKSNRMGNGVWTKRQIELDNQNEWRVLHVAGRLPEEN